jgi:mannose-6-phosphate isomerase-like protein (cupin superfamily)
VNRRQGWLKKEEKVSPFYRWTDILRDLEPGLTVPAGMSRRGITLGEVMLGLHEALPNLKPSPHRHPSSQITYMLKGKIRMTIGGEERVIGPGEFAHIPPNELHGFEALDEFALILDIFNPPRADVAARLKELAEKK